MRQINFFRLILLFYISSSCALQAFAQLPPYEIVATNIPRADYGSITRYSVWSEEVNDYFIVDVWVPDGYNTDISTSYPVIYAEDGQNLFDKHLSFASVAWELDDKAQTLTNQGYISAPIIVGINNRGGKNLRVNDYFPEKVLDYIPEDDKSNTKIFETCKDGFYGDEYALFVSTGLKSLIDKLYRTNPDKSHTFAMGSSMGGLISLYLMCEYPDIFGAAVCMSTHWIGSLNLNADYTMNDDPVCAEAILAYMNINLPSAGDHRLYLDQGTAGWDAEYLKYEHTAREIAVEHGYSTQSGSLMTFDASNAGHNEWFWQQRADKPLVFLLNKEYFASEPEIIASSIKDRRYINLSGVVIECDDTIQLNKGIYIHNGHKILVP